MLDCISNCHILYANGNSSDSYNDEYFLLLFQVLTLDYASLVFAGFTAISGVWYFVWGRKHFVGPVMHVKGPDGEIRAVDAKPMNGDASDASDSTGAL
jgi:hypothetical protein